MYIWATQFDRIRIGYCDPIGNQGHVYVRLIGPPDRAVNLHLVPPKDDGLVAEMQISNDPLIPESSDVELFERTERVFFCRHMCLPSAARSRQMEV